MTQIEVRDDANLGDLLGRLTLTLSTGLPIIRAYMTHASLDAGVLDYFLVELSALPHALDEAFSGVNATPGFQDVIADLRSVTDWIETANPALRLEKGKT